MLEALQFLNHMCHYTPGDSDAGKYLVKPQNATILKIYTYSYFLVRRAAFYIFSSKCKFCDWLFILC